MPKMLRTIRIVNKQQTVSHAACPKRSTNKKRTCLGVRVDGTYCSNEFDSLDAADRICPECKKENRIEPGKTHEIKRIQHSALRTVY